MSSLIGAGAAHESNNFIRRHLKVAAAKAFDQFLASRFSTLATGGLNQTHDVGDDLKFDIRTRHQTSAFPHLQRDSNLAFRCNAHRANFLTARGKNSTCAPLFPGKSAL